MTTQYTTVARVGDIAEGEGKAFQIGRHVVAVFLVGGKYHAMDDFCPHMGDSLSQGILNDGTIVCNQHLWAFDLESGTCVDVPSLKAPVFEVRVVDDEIQVGMPDEKEEED